MTFARGSYTIGKSLEESINNTISQKLESLTNFDGVMIFSSLAGGVGSGLMSNIVKKWKNNYSNNLSLGIHLLPSKDLMGEACEVYNAVLALGE